MKSVILILLAILLFAGCKKVDIQNYTLIDESGSWTIRDADDWRITDIPDKAIRMLDAIPSHPGDNGPYGIAWQPAKTYAFPNPSRYRLDFYNYDSTRSQYSARYVIVDSKNQNFRSGAVSGGSIAQIDVRSMPNGLYRMYYASYDSLGHRYSTGYGDVKIDHQ